MPAGLYRSTIPLSHRRAPHTQTLHSPPLHSPPPPFPLRDSDSRRTRPQEQWSPHSDTADRRGDVLRALNISSTGDVLRAVRNLSLHLRNCRDRVSNAAASAGRCMCNTLRTRVPVYRRCSLYNDNSGGVAFREVELLFSLLSLRARPLHSRRPSCPDMSSQP